MPAVPIESVVILPIALYGTTSENETVEMFSWLVALVMAVGLYNWYDSHLECKNSKCVSVRGRDKDTCSIDVQCII